MVVEDAGRVGVDHVDAVAAILGTQIRVALDPIALDQYIAVALEEDAETLPQHMVVADHRFVGGRLQEYRRVHVGQIVARIAQLATFNGHVRCAHRKDVALVLTTNHRARRAAERHRLVNQKLSAVFAARQRPAIVALCLQWQSGNGLRFRQSGPAGNHQRYKRQWLQSMSSLKSEHSYYLLSASRRVMQHGDHTGSPCWK